MSDFLLELGQNRIARQLIQNLGLPIPVPNPLKRAKGPMQAKPLAGQTIALGTSAGAELTSTLETVLSDAGATVRKDTPSEGEKVSALVFDATGLSNPADLSGLYAFFHPWIGALGKNGRIVVIGRRDEVLFEKAYGSRALLPERQPMSIETVFDLASISKLFTARLDRSCWASGPRTYVVVMWNDWS